MEYEVMVIKWNIKSWVLMEYEVMVIKCNI